MPLHAHSACPATTQQKAGTDRRRRPRTPDRGDKQAAAADGQATPTTTRQASQQAEPPNAASSTAQLAEANPSQRPRPAGGVPNHGQVLQRQVLDHDDHVAASDSLKFLDDFFGPEKRHLVAIRKREDGTSQIEAHHFQAVDRAGQQRFITEHQAAGYDLYFTPNPVTGVLHKKASKNDIPEGRWLWVDMDPRKGRPLEEERAAMLALLTTNLPPGIPRANRVIDSGRGYWGFWKLETPQPVDGKDGQLTTTVESYGRGLEQAFRPYADNCYNIDRIGRLPETRNSKTGAIARVSHEYSHDTPHAIESFPRASNQKQKLDAARTIDFEVLDKYELVTRGRP
jgi:hypothetical protein